MLARFWQHCKADPWMATAWLIDTVVALVFSWHLGGFF